MTLIRILLWFAAFGFLAFLFVAFFSLAFALQLLEAMIR